MKKILPYLMTLAIFAACKKNEKTLPPEKPVTIGSFSGMVTPANAVTEITAIRADGKKSYLIKIDPASGTFNLADLEEGDYLLNFNTDAKYESIANLSARVIGGQNTILAAVNTKEIINVPPPAPGTESFSGTITPVAAAPRMKLYNVGPIGYVRSYNVAMDPASGQFSLGNIPAGDYFLSFEPSSGYNKIDNIYFTITAGKSADLGPVVFTVNTDRAVGYPLSFDVNGTPTSWMPTTTFSASNLTIAYFSAPILPRQISVMYRPSIMLKGVIGPGTYVCSKSTGNFIRYTAYRSSSGFASIQDTSDPGSEGTVVITAIDRVNRIIKGTFSASLAARPGNVESAKLLTNGVINANY